MTEILQSSPSQFPSSPSTTPNDGTPHLNQSPLFNSPNLYSVTVYDTEEEEGGSSRGERKGREKEERDHQLSLLEVFVTVFRKSLIGCRSESADQDFTSCSSSSCYSFSSASMEIGCPTNVRHVAHVTFDRFNGFLGLPVEFEPEVPRRPPSASTSVFGVSTESMQLSFDSRGNSVPTILLMMQRHLYTRGGLQAEGIFRITAENSEEEYVREQLNTGVVPDDVDVHCLAGLIKAWFRELPNGLLDSIPPEEVMQAQSEEDCCQLVRRLPPTEASLLDWAINLMADVAQLEHLNKMNAHNVAMVFAPNMTQMADPLTALMHAVQVMNFLKTLIVLTLREREDSILEQALLTQTDPSDDNEHHRHSFLQPIFEEPNEVNEEEHLFITHEPFSESPLCPNIIDDESKIENEVDSFLTSIENIIPGGKGHLVPNQVEIMINRLEEGGSSCQSQGAQQNPQKKKIGHSSSSSLKKGPKRIDDRLVAAQAVRKMERNKGSTIVSRLNSRNERVEAWR
ncbi:rho GTPase-activating protein 5-like [Rhododendron vialii]|uniref:rho GTPase-activating protein 5-like n=1 Tax=Rhododendron vialii TaxID=182163 RepID=UPI00265EAC1C|nr:rho GTPase-activating protein 5-like [Rhododendron vialii]